MKQLLLLVILICAQPYSFGQTIHDVVLEMDSMTVTNSKELSKIRKGDFYRIRIKNINLTDYRVIINKSDTNLYEPVNLTTIGGLDLSAISKLFESVISITESTLLPERYNVHDGEGITHRDTSSSTIDSACLIALNNIDLHRKQIFDLYFDLSNYAANFEMWKTQDEEKLRTTFFAWVEKIRMRLKSISDDVYAGKLEFQQLAFDEKTTLKNIDSIQLAYSKIFTALMEALNELRQDKLQVAFENLRASFQNKTTTYVSMPIQFQKDRDHISLQIEPVKDSTYLQSFSADWYVPFKRKYYFSVGSGFYVSGLYDEHFSTQGKAISDTSSAYRLIQETGNKLETGVHVMSHVGYKIGDKDIVAFEFCAGAGVSFTKNVRPRYLIGGGFSFGDRHRFTIDGGMIGGYVDRLSKAFSVSEEYAYGNMPESVQVSQFEFSYFGSIGYILTF